MILVYLILLLLTVCAVKLWLYQKSVSFAKVLPAIEPNYPLLGNVPMIVGKSEEERFWIVSNALSNPAGLFRCMVTLMPVLCTNDPEIAKIVLTQCLEKPFITEFINLDHGLFSAHYDIWKRQRRVLNPTFNIIKVHNSIPLFENCAQRLVQKLAPVSNGEEIDISKMLLQCTLEMVTASTIGIGIHESTNANRLVQIIIREFFLSAKRILRIHWHKDWIYKLTKDYRESVKLRAEGNSYAEEILQDAIKRKRSKETIAEGNIVDDDGSKKQPIFVDQLLDSFEGNKLEDKEIIQNIYTIIMAGSDTSSTTMCFIMLMLAMYPDLQEKVYQEIIAVLPAESSTPISPESLMQLRYTEMFIKECLRLFPVGPHLSRHTTAEVDLNGFKVPKGISIVVSIYNIHRRKDIWGPNADSFDPENFSEERSAGRHPFAYLPFCGGTRNCIGARYAMVSMKIVLVHLLRNYKFKTHWKYEDLRFRFAETLKTINEPKVYLERRERAVTVPFGEDITKVRPVECKMREKAMSSNNERQR